MTLDELPTQLGGRNPCSETLQPVPSRRIPSNEYYQQKASNDPPKTQLAHIQLHVGQRKFVPIQCHAGKKLNWFFTSDGDLLFGVFFRKGQSEPLVTPTEGDILDKLEMAHPYFRLGAKLVPERGSVKCEENGTYYVVLCNKHSWFYKRNVHLKIEIDGTAVDRKALMESAFVL